MKEIVGVDEPVGSSLAGKEVVGVTDSDAEALVPRDQWDRPLILPAEGHKDRCEPRTGKGGGCKCMEGYTRVSTMAESLSDPFGLNRWQKGNVLKGLVHKPALLNLARIAETKSDLYSVVDVAEQLGDERGAAENGTFMHRLTEMLDNGEDLPDGLPDYVMAMLDAYVREVHVKQALVTVSTEQFVVQDKVKCAGTYDKIVQAPDGLRRVADLKTGQSLDNTALKVTMQVAIYAASQHYDIGTHERTPLGVDRDKGYVIWLPWTEDPAQAECEVRWLDLANVGRPAVLEAIRVRDFRKLKPEQILPRVR